MDTCPHCSSAKLRKHGLARNGKQRYFCPDCRRTSRPAPGTNAYDEARKAEILRAYQERTSLRGLTRIFGVSRQTVTAWLKKSPTTAAAEPDAGPAATR
jgi:transposase-like protein